jgi:hypothetical protein
MELVVAYPFTSSCSTIKIYSEIRSDSCVAIGVRHFSHKYKTTNKMRDICHKKRDLTELNMKYDWQKESRQMDKVTLQGYSVVPTKLLRQNLINTTTST